MSGQLILTPASESFYQRVEWEDGLALGWRPHDDPRSPVRMLPGVRFGRPSVRGISTEVLWEYTDAGETAREVAKDFDLTVNDVWWALAYETSLRAA